MVIASLDKDDAGVDLSNDADIQLLPDRDDTRRKQDTGLATSLLREFGRLAIEEHQSFETLRTAAGHDFKPYRALPAAPPLGFLHVPKTGGASVRRWLVSMFEPHEVAPLISSDNFETLRGPGREYKLYAGHLLGIQIDLLPPNTQLFSLVRDPVAIAASQYYHIRALVDWAKFKSGYITDNPFYTDPEPSPEALALSMLFHENDFATAISMPLPAARQHFRDVLLHIYGGTFDEFAVGDDLPDDSPVLREIRAAQWDRAVSVLDRIALVGDHADIEGALLLLAARRGWPAPPALPRIHDFGAPSTATAADAAIRSQFGATSQMELALYDRASRRARLVRSKLKRLCGTDTAEAVDRRHTACFFRTAPRIAGFDVRAGQPWSGRGWGIPQNGPGAPQIDGLFADSFREIGARRSSSMLVALEPAIGEMRLFVEIRRDPAGNVVTSLAARVAGVPLERMEVRSEPCGATITWRVPADQIALLDGAIEFVFDIPEVQSNQTPRIARVGCVPAAPV
jgi:hypothetical protein